MDANLNVIRDYIENSHAKTAGKMLPAPPSMHSHNLRDRCRITAMRSSTQRINQASHGSASLPPITSPLSDVCHPRETIRERAK
jgi:hypothetical protein